GILLSWRPRLLNLVVRPRRRGWARAASPGCRARATSAACHVGTVPDAARLRELHLPRHARGTGLPQPPCLPGATPPLPRPRARPGGRRPPVGADGGADPAGRRPPTLPGRGGPLPPLPRPRRRPLRLGAPRGGG